MADNNTNYPTIVPLTEMSPERTAEVAELLVDAVDLHCHSGPAAMPRILGHTEAFQMAEDAGFKALLYKDHYYVGMPHCAVLKDIYPDSKVELYSGVALNNASGGINPHAVDHNIKLGGKIVWFPTFAAKNHIEAYASKSFPKTAKPMLPPIPLTVLDANGKLIDEAKQICDLIAEADIILAGGHLSAAELFVLFEEAAKRGVKKMLVNHPSYIIGCSDEDIRGLVGLGAYMEHSICMFIPGRAKQHETEDLIHMMEVAGVDRTVLGSDLGLTQAPKPVDGYRMIVSDLLDHQVDKADIKKIISTNASGLINLAA
ncbi:DUF6282 family protein [Tianweitania populi]|uniref:Cytosolic protein n=1 Tax=Tianweitania populi TaxID=1607949 RepID=A0A8J3DY16_9HYPH|nr:DUF6282 family protein [Tianweitania populi]GHD22721.1 hypothetical protein GCM10016234_37260 [Tianweitania populi]